MTSLTCSINRFANEIWNDYVIEIYILYEFGVSCNVESSRDSGKGANNSERYLKRVCIFSRQQPVWCKNGDKVRQRASNGVPAPAPAPVYIAIVESALAINIS